MSETDWIDLGAMEEHRDLVDAVTLAALPFVDVDGGEVIGTYVRENDGGTEVMVRIAPELEGDDDGDDDEE